MRNKSHWTVLHARPGSLPHTALKKWHETKVKIWRRSDQEAKAPEELEPLFAEPGPDDTHWIEIEMADKAGHPAQGVSYRIELPDGSIKAGSLDDEGRARVKQIGQGTCKVSFPFLGDDDWGDGEDKNAIEAQIVNALGEVQKEMAYELVLPDGSKLSGKTDGEGFIKHEVGVSGDCWLTLPDYAKGA